MPLFPVVAGGVGRAALGLGRGLGWLKRAPHVPKELLGRAGQGTIAKGKEMIPAPNWTTGQGTRHVLGYPSTMGQLGGNIALGVGVPMGMSAAMSDSGPQASDEDLETMMLLQQLQGTYPGGVESFGSSLGEMDPRLQMQMFNEDINRMQQFSDSWAEEDFLQELMEENAQLLSQVSQRVGNMSGMVDPAAMLGPGMSY